MTLHVLLPTGMQPKNNQLPNRCPTCGGAAIKRYSGPAIGEPEGQMTEYDCGLVLVYGAGEQDPRVSVPCAKAAYERVLPPVIQLPDHCPACDSPIESWEFREEPGSMVDPPQRADYECGLELVLVSYGRHKDIPQAASGCRNSYEAALKQRRQS